MPVNLMNENAVHKFLKDSIYGYDKVQGLSAEMLKSPEAVRENREAIIQAISFQWMKAKFRNYLTQNDKSDYLEKVTSFNPNSPFWLMLNVAKGGNVYRFNRKNVPFEKLQQLGKVRNFLTQVAERYVDEQLKLKKPRIRLDYLKTDHKIDSVEKVLIHYNKMMSRINFNNGTKEILGFQDGYKVVQLMTSDAFKAEGKGMEHCLGRENYYAYYGKSHEFYSLRDNKNQPHVTIQVKDNEVVQINGKGATAVNGKYHKYVYEFVKGRNFRVGELAQADMGMIKVGDEIFSIHNLPKDICMQLDNLDIGEYGLRKMPDLTNVKVKEDFDISNSEFKNIKGCPICKNLRIYDCVDFEEDFLKDLPLSVEKIEGFEMPIKCLKYLPKGSALKEVELYDNHGASKQLFEIPHAILKKINFTGVDIEFNKQYQEALETGNMISILYNNIQQQRFVGSFRA